MDRGVVLALALAGVAIAGPARAVEEGAQDRVTTHAVAIATGGPSSPTLRCSGTLISPNVVLTARHCIAHVADPNPGCAVNLADPVGAPGDLWITAAPWSSPGTAWRKVLRWVVPTPTGACGNDVALLVIETPFALSDATPARPVTTAAGFREVVSGRVLGIAAFGASSAVSHDEGTRRSRWDVPITCVPGDLDFACDHDLEAIDPLEITAGRGPCPGDSGAGAGAPNDRDVVFGVLARARLDGDACAAGVFERTDVWAWLLASTVIEASSSELPPPPWATSVFPAHAAVGEMCRDGTVCDPSARCVSIDADRSWTCRTRCDAGCAATEQCEAASTICVPAAAPPIRSDHGGCTIARPRSSLLSPLIVALVVLVVVRRLSRR